MGLVFLTDLMFILRQFNFHEILTQPVKKLVMNLNGTEEDRKMYKDKNMKERGNQEANDALSEIFSDNTSHTNR
jgi:hypothetical protein